MSDLNKYKNLIEELPMITTELYPWKLEINGDVIRLLAADGKPVVTYVADLATNTLNVLFENQNIDFDNLRDDCCKCAGESFSCAIECRSAYDLMACVHGFICLTADGYALPQTNMIDLDLADVEQVIAKGATGVYRTALVDPAKTKACAMNLLQSIWDEWLDVNYIILRYEGDFYLNQISKYLDDEEEIMVDLVMANYLPGQEDYVRVDMWAF